MVRVRIRVRVPVGAPKSRSLVGENTPLTLGRSQVRVLPGLLRFFGSSWTSRRWRGRGSRCSWRGRRSRWRGCRSCRGSRRRRWRCRSCRCGCSRRRSSTGSSTSRCRGCRSRSRRRSRHRGDRRRRCRSWPCRSWRHYRGSRCGLGGWHIRRSRRCGTGRRKLDINPERLRRSWRGRRACCCLWRLCRSRRRHLLGRRLWDYGGHPDVCGNTRIVRTREQEGEAQKKAYGHRQDYNQSCHPRPERKGSDIID